MLSLRNARRDAHAGRAHLGGSPRVAIDRQSAGPHELTDQRAPGECSAGYERAERPIHYQHESELEQLEYRRTRLLLLRAAVTGVYLTMGPLLVTSISAGLNLLMPQLVALVSITLGVF